MKHRKTLLYGGIAMAGVWALALGGILFAQSRAVTPEKVIRYIQENPLEGKSPEQRREIVQELANKVVRMDFEQRREMRNDRELWRAFDRMTDEERRIYLDATLPSGMKQMMKAFNEMTREKRQQVVEDALNRMKRDAHKVGREEMQKRLRDENTQRIIDEGMKAFVTEANAATKIDLQPLLEQIQRMLQMDSPHRR